MSTARGARDETELLERARDGDEGAFGELVESYRSELRGHCYRMLGSAADAEDTARMAAPRPAALPLEAPGHAGERAAGRGLLHLG